MGRKLLVHVAVVDKNEWEKNVMVHMVKNMQTVGLKVFPDMRASKRFPYGSPHLSFMRQVWVPINGNSIPCLSGYGHHVYTVEPSVKVPDSCRAIKTVEIPFGYSSYLSDNSFGLGLTWELPKRDDEDGDDGFEEERTWVHLTTKK
ncbi:hypothetical protein Godav_021686, partial [Gossypium davidsonii]|nr:hypothetical protein [Gossypium davidsonii]